MATKECNKCGKSKSVEKFRRYDIQTCKKCEYRWWQRILRMMAYQRKLTPYEKFASRIGYLGTGFLISAEMGRKMYVMNGGKLGRKVGSVENRKDFLQKDRTKKIISLLEKGKSVRDISHRLGVSTKTIVKVRKYVEI